MTQTSAASRNQTIGIPLHFLFWYVFERPAMIVRAYGRYAKAFGEVFSFVYMIKTFLAPWKSINDDYPTKGFNLQMIIETLTLNVTSRIIGMLFRLSAIITGLLIQIMLFVLCTVYLIAWIAYPVVVIAGIVFLFRFQG